MAYSLKQSISVLMKVHFVFMNQIHFKRKKARGQLISARLVIGVSVFHFCLQVDGPVIVTGGKKGEGL